MIIEPGVIAHDVLPPDVETQTAVRRMRLAPSDFLVHGYTAGCPGCVALRRKTGQSKNHSEACRLRMKQCLTGTSEGRSRKEREAGRREEELTAAIPAEDARITKDHELNEQATKDAATAASSTDPRPLASEEVAAEVRQSRKDSDHHNA